MRGRVIIGSVAIGLLASIAPGAPAATKPERGYITNQFSLPTDPEEAEAFARDLDGDGTKDNQFGNIVAALTQAAGSGTLGFDTATGEAVLSGDIVMAHSLRTFSLANTKNATWQVWYGQPNPDIKLDGTDSVELLAGQPHSAKLAATIKNHVVKTVAGNIPLRLDFGAGPFVLKMSRAKIVATCTRAGCMNGKLTGALSAADIEAKLLPEIAKWINAVVAEDCPGPDPDSCATNSTGETLIGVFPEAFGPGDLVATPQELMENSLVQTLLRPDLNLVSGDGGQEDHMSFGFGLTTVKATLTRP